MGRKRINALATVALLLAAAATVLYGVTNVMREDHTPPEITVAQDTITASVDDFAQHLLDGITASDSQDGDVTGSIVVERISDLSAERTAVVTYAAFDRSGNVAKATRTLALSDYRQPRFYQKRALVMPENSNQDVLGFMGAEDLIDGDISGHIKGGLVSDTVSLSRPGAHEVEFRVTNSMGDTTRITLPVDVYPATAFNASVTLSNYLVYLPKGSSFVPERYLRTLQVGSMQFDLDGSDPDVEVLFGPGGESTRRYPIRVDMNSTVNTAVAGVYSVTYTVSMNDQYAGFTRLNVIVEE